VHVGMVMSSLRRYVVHVGMVMSLAVCSLATEMADPKLAAAAHQYSSMVECDGNNMWGS
jgi:hypothetical protein